MEDFLILSYYDATERHHQEKIRLKRLRDASNPFELAEEKFRKIFRLPKSGAIELVNILDTPRLSGGQIQKHLKILSALQFFAQGSYQTAVGQDNFMALSQPSISRCVDATVEAIILKLTPKTIKFPTTQDEKLRAKTEFQDLFNITNTLGAVDGTHIAIAKPQLNHPTAPGSLFFNRKGFYSINCQIICSAKGIIIGLNPNFPGSTHDAAIWRASKINTYLKNEFVRGEHDQWLLGDKGYPLQPWLMTPTDVPSLAANTYNRCHARARNVVELCNGRLKNKFRCLHRHRCLHYEPKKAAKIILACCTLYNMFYDAFNFDDELSLEDDLSPSYEDPINSNLMEDDFLAQARIIRQNLINTWCE